MSPRLLSQHLKLSPLQEELHYSDMLSQVSSLPEVRIQAKDRGPVSSDITVSVGRRTIIAF